MDRQFAPICGLLAIRYFADMFANADNLIGEIDSIAISPMTHAVTRRLYKHIPLGDGLPNELVTAFDKGCQPHEMAAFQAALWREIESLSFERQGGLRLLVALTRPNEIIDWYLAEFMIRWARQQGVAEQKIIDAFHMRANGS